MVHINTWRRGILVSAYTAADEDVPRGTPIGRKGNAVLIKDRDKVHIVFRPRIEGDILDVLPEARKAPKIDLLGYF